MSLLACAPKLPDTGKNFLRNLLSRGPKAFSYYHIDNIAKFLIKQNVHPFQIFRFQQTAKTTMVTEDMVVQLQWFK